MKTLIHEIGVIDKKGISTLLILKLDLMLLPVNHQRVKVP